MFDWLKPLAMMFYAPVRGMREVRDRAPFIASAFLALAVHAALLLLLWALFLRPRFLFGTFLVAGTMTLQAAGALLYLAAIFVPIAIFVANTFERKLSFRLVLQQEYTATASTTFFAWTIANVIAALLAVAGKASGVLVSVSQAMITQVEERRRELPPDAFPSLQPETMNAPAVAFGLVLLLMLAAFGVWAVVAIREGFRFSTLRSVVVIALTGAVMFPASFVVMPLFSRILATPFLLLLVFLLLRGYVGEFMRLSRSRSSFKQNLEAATLNPADSSAHYNLGLIHQQLGQDDAARERYQRAIEIDWDEIDAHYQLGRIARSQKRLSDAIGHFEQVVSRNRGHAQYEVWREVGATYLEAGQCEDSLAALEKFLDSRPSDPEGLYLKGRAHAALGDRREAESLMKACIEAVRSAPAYKYKLEKRWLNEAQQFLRSLATKA